MAAILSDDIANAFSWKQIIVVWLEYDWNVFPRAQNQNTTALP